MMSSIVEVMVAIIGATIGIAIGTTIMTRLFPFFSAGWIIFSAVLSILLSVFIVLKRQQKREGELEKRAEKLKEELKAELKTDIIISEKPLTTTTPDGKEGVKKLLEINVLGMMLEILSDIRVYYILSYQQAKSAFAFAILMTVAGFGLIVFAVVLVGVLEKPLEVAIISAIGGVITELLAATVMIIYRNSIAQLNHYHQALHEDERFWSGINLIEKFADKKLRDEMLQKLIQSEIDLNLAEVGKNPDEEEKKEKEEKSDETADKKEKEEPKEGQKDESEDSA